MSDLYCSVSGTPHQGELVLVHGWGLNGTVWSPLLPWLEEAFRVHCVDLPGLGRSAALNGPVTLAALAKRILAEVPERALWVGWSLGGLVAAQAAHLAPQRVAALVTIASNPSFVQRDGWPGMAPETFAGFQTALAQQADKTLQRFLGLQVQGDPQAREQLRLLRHCLTVAEASPAADSLAATLQLLAEDQRALFAALTQPQHHLLGALDGLVPAAVLTPWEQLQPGAGVEVLPDSAHLPFVGTPQRVADRILQLAQRARLTAGGDL